VVPKLFLIAYHMWALYFPRVPPWKHFVPGKLFLPNIIRSKVWETRLDTNAAWTKCLQEIIMAIFRNYSGKHTNVQEFITWQFPSKEEEQHMFRTIPWEHWLIGSVHGTPKLTIKDNLLYFSQLSTLSSSWFIFVINSCIEFADSERTVSSAKRMVFEIWD